MACVVVVGGSGFIGLNIVESLLSINYEVINISRRPIPQEASQFFLDNENFHQELCDARDIQSVEAILKRYNPDVVIQSCAITPRATDEICKFSETIEVNCLCTIKLAEISKKNGASHFIYLGSVAAYGDSCQGEMIVQENTTSYNPISVYDYSKYFTEKLLLRYRCLTDYQISILRLGDVFGPWERATESRHVMSAPTQVLELLSAGKAIVLPKKGTTGWIYSRDVGAAVAVIASGRPRHSVYHISNETVWSVFDFARYAAKSFHNENVSIDPKASNVSFFSEKDNGVFSTENLYKDYAFKCNYGMKEAADDFIRWWESIDRDNLFI